MKTVISYLRFSTPEQLKGDSQRRQLEASEEWAKRHGYNISDRYKDLGISAFKSANRQFGKLASILKQVEDGRIPKGTILLVESVDRLSRANVTDAVELFMGLINRGIEIVTLIDGMQYSKASIDRNPMELMVSILKMSVANEESAKKSERLGKAWQEKRRQARNGKDMKALLPYWIKRKDGKFVLDDKKANAVRAIFQMSQAGIGIDRIVIDLNRKGVPCIGKTPTWQHSYVSKLLHNRAVIGEYQPFTGSAAKGGKRLPVGEPIPNYFPAIISEKQYYAVQAGLTKRRNTGGPQTKWVNLFTGLLHDLEGNSYVINDKGYGKRFVNSAALKGLGEFVGFPVRAFEMAFIMRFADQKLWQTDAPQTHQVELDALQGKIDAEDRAIARIQAQTMAGEMSDGVVQLINSMDARKREWEKQRDALRATVAFKSDSGDAAKEFGKLLWESGEMPNESRLALRGVIARLVRDITCVFKRYGQHNYVCSGIVTLHTGKEIELAFRAIRNNRMLRDKLGHPVKGGAKGPPTYTIQQVTNLDETMEGFLRAVIDIEREKARYPVK